MSSPATAPSPPYPSSTTLPRKRPSINTADTPSNKRRKPSGVGSALSSGHPLRQTSFPPPENALASRASSFSPAASVTGRSSLLGTGRRGRGGRRKADARSQTGASGTDTGVGTKAGSLVGGRSGVNGAAATGQKGGAGVEEEDADEDEEDDALDTVLEAGAMPDEAQLKLERENMRMLIDAFDGEQADRYDMWRRVRLNKAVVRRVSSP